jgi:hypothetical protein
MEAWVVWDLLVYGCISAPLVKEGCFKKHNLNSQGANLEGQFYELSK